MNFAHITPLILSFDEEANIGALLDDLRDFPRVLVVDSGSADATLTICARHANVTVLTRPFDSHSAQCNFGVDQIGTEWILSLDADYRLPAAVLREIAALPGQDASDGYYARFQYAVYGTVLRSALLPPRCILFRRGSARYIQDGHAHRLAIHSACRTFDSPIQHDDHKPLMRWLRSQITYAMLEVDKLNDTGTPLALPDRLRRKILITPWLVPLYVLFVRGGVLDGWAGLHYAMSRMIAESILSLMLLDRRLRGR